MEMQNRITPLLPRHIRAQEQVGVFSGFQPSEVMWSNRFVLEELPDMILVSKGILRDPTNCVAEEIKTDPLLRELFFEVQYMPPVTYGGCEIPEMYRRHMAITEALVITLSLKGPATSTYRGRFGSHFVRPISGDRGRLEAQCDEFVPISNMVQQNHTSIPSPLYVFDGEACRSITMTYALVF